MPYLKGYLGKLGKKARTNSTNATIPLRNAGETCKKKPLDPQFLQKHDEKHLKQSFECANLTFQNIDS